MNRTPLPVRKLNHDLANLLEMDIKHVAYQGHENWKVKFLIPVNHNLVKAMLLGRLKQRYREPDFKETPEGCIVTLHLYSEMPARKKYRKKERMF